MTESLIQAYSNSPRRQKLQILGGFFLTLVILAMLLISYLVVSARAVSKGRELQRAKDEIDNLVYLNVNYRSKISEFMQFDDLEVRADELGFRAPYPGEVFYVELAGFDVESGRTVVIGNDTQIAKIDLNLRDYHETLFQWMGRQIQIFLHPFEDL
jgi:hypothetical protein